MECKWGLEPKDRHCEYCCVWCDLRPDVKSIATTAIVIPTTIKATMEKSKDGLYCITSDCRIGNSFLGGYGSTESTAKEDFQDSLLEAVNENVTIEFE